MRSRRAFLQHTAVGTATTAAVAMLPTSFVAPGRGAQIPAEGPRCEIAPGEVLGLPEFEERAQRCMGPMAYEFVAPGSHYRPA